MSICADFKIKLIKSIKSNVFICIHHISLKQIQVCLQRIQNTLVKWIHVRGGAV